MKQLRLIALVLAVSACFASLVLAGGKGKGARSSDCCGEKATATAAGTCSMHGTTAAAAAGTCAMHGNATTTAAASGCATNGKSAKMAGACPMHGVSAAGGKCDMAAGANINCLVCADEVACDEEMRGLNSHAQVVELRNGAMIVYTADTPENVRALQVAIARHNEQVVNALAANSETALCSGCKAFRGAMASGKFSRELVNVKTGAQVLLTSNDRTIVRRIHELAGTPSARIKT